MITHQTLQGADHVRLHLAQAGESGRVLLFLHGFPEYWRAWQSQLLEFSVDHRAGALDLRGYNDSEKPAGEEAYALPKLVEDVRLVLQALTPSRPAVLVGHDWGGIIAWALAWEYPELLSRLVIINAPHPSAFVRELGRNVVQDLASSYAGFFQLRGLAEPALKAFDYAALKKMVFGLTCRPGAFDSELRAAYETAWSKPGALEAMLAYYRNISAFTAAAERMKTRKIEVPTLVLWGEKDPSLLTSNLVDLDQHVSTLAVRRHAAATHWIVHEEPRWVSEAIRAFIAT